MISDIATIIWKEWKEFLAQGGGRRSSKFGLLIAIGVPGVWLPAQIGESWVTSPLPLFIAIWIAIFSIISLIADSFAGERERHTLETLLASRLSDRAILFGKVGAAVSYGWIITIAIMVLSLIVVNVVHGHGQLLMYSATRIVAIVVVSALLSLLAASVGVLVSMRAATVRQAAQVLSIAIMFIFLVPAIAIQLLPDRWLNKLSDTADRIGINWLIAVGLFLVIVADAVLIGLAMLRFQRSRMTFD